MANFNPELAPRRQAGYYSTLNSTLSPFNLHIVYHNGWWRRKEAWTVHGMVGQPWLPAAAWYHHLRHGPEPSACPRRCRSRRCLQHLPQNQGSNPLLGRPHAYRIRTHELGHREQRVPQLQAGSPGARRRRGVNV